METNVGKVDRIVRIVVGIILLFAAAVGIVTGIAMYAAVIIGLILLVTGILAKCPIYSITKISTSKKAEA
jgi:uncharacterized membrane protein